MFIPFHRSKRRCMVEYQVLRSCSAVCTNVPRSKSLAPHTKPTNSQTPFLFHLRDWCRTSNILACLGCTSNKCTHMRADWSHARVGISLRQNCCCDHSCCISSCNECTRRNLKQLLMACASCRHKRRTRIMPTLTHKRRRAFVPCGCGGDLGGTVKSSPPICGEAGGRVLHCIACHGISWHEMVHPRASM